MDIKTKTLHLCIDSLIIAALYILLVPVAMIWSIATIDEGCQEVGQARGLISTTEPKLVTLGTFEIYHYCPCQLCTPGHNITATGTAPAEGRTIAVDPAVIPLGSKIIIEGKQYIAEDTGSDIKGNKIDMFISDHQTALELGVKTAEVMQWK